jgi:hypothetical protein
MRASSTARNAVLHLAWLFLLLLLLGVAPFKRAVKLCTAAATGISTSLVTEGIQASTCAASSASNAASSALAAASVAVAVTDGVEVSPTSCAMLLVVARVADAATCDALPRLAAFSAARIAQHADFLTRLVRAEARPATAAVLPSAASEPSTASAAGRSRYAARVSAPLIVRT